ncbi:NACHT domain-containing protein [Cognaticolwellia mytili]|uniref:NACHT domain-containing protein n=1 Tax=Cognaticolwellia mytili TaxID=1888913 RepID=UPI000A1728E3|nr:hypothetical protein [Cognaticolwellia mytili]
MSLESSQIIEKYRKYGFEYKKNYSNNSYLTFTFKSGFFHNAEVVQLGNDPDDKQAINKKIDSLMDLGVSVKTKTYQSFEEIEKSLFEGFFDVSSWKERIQGEYDEYVSGILKSLPEGDNEYSYINAPYDTHSSPIKCDGDIISDILTNVGNDGAQLILVEAPAGFGKTCTSYELIKTLINKDGYPIPFFTEFSRDRQAKIFSHVFIREVDRAFNQVKSHVVEYELKNGRVIMVLDGFDELLSDTATKDDIDNYENAEPMLETISDLLSGNAKIIITSRRSAMFDGAVFNEWVEKYEDKFKFRRFRLNSPRIEDWLSFSRREQLINCGIKIEKLSNPVLLAYLRSLTDDSFSNLCKTPNLIVEHYFSAMLEREQNRQDLLMPPEKQSLLLTKLASDMCSKDYTSDQKEKVVDFFKSECGLLLEDTRKLYSAKNRPTIDSLANTLATHAFFDRSNQGDGRIEFINEFVFGNYIAQDILTSTSEWIASDERFVEPAMSSFEPRTKENRFALWNKLKPMSEFLSESDRFKYEIKMLAGVTSNKFSDTSINSIDINNIDFFDTVCVNNISFSNCSFSNVTFYVDNIKNITLISCKFYDCVVVGEFKNSDLFIFLNCVDNNGFIHEIENQSVDDSDDGINPLAKCIFEKFWNVGSNSFDRLHIPLSSIYKSLQAQGYNKREITKEIKILKKVNYLANASDGGYIAIDKSRLTDIKVLLGRV